MTESHEQQAMTKMGQEEKRRSKIVNQPTLFFVEGVALEQNVTISGTTTMTVEYNA